MRQFKMPNRDQLLLLPPNLNDWIGKDHPARFVLAFVETIDLTDFYADYEDGRGGQPPYDPKMMLAICLYAQLRGICSTRKIELMLQEDIGFRFLGANLKPDHDTIADFRQRHAERLRNVFGSSVQLALKSSIVRLGHVAIDGTKIRANAAKSARKTKEQLKQEQDRIKEIVGAYLDECDEVDRREDEEFGKGNNGYLLPEFLQDEEQLKKWIAKSLKELNAQPEESNEPEVKSGSEKQKKGAREKRLQKKLENLQEAETALDELVKEKQKDDPTGKRKRDGDRKRGSEQVAKINVTDPESRKMLFPDGTYKEGYNCQIVVDDEAGVIVAANVTQDANDLRQLLPMVLQVQTNTGWLPDHVSGDNGYCNFEHMEDPSVKSVEFYIPPRARGAKEAHDTKSERMREKLETPLGSALYSARKAIVEPVFGAIKHARRFRQMLTRGKSMVTAEWMLWCTAHNLAKMFNAGVRFA
jgi:transposase